MHKEIGLKIAEFVHYAKCRAQRALGARERAANKKKRGGLLLHVVCGIATPFTITIVVAEAIDHCVKGDTSHLLKAERADQDSAFRSHVASGNPELFTLIV